MGKNSGLAKTLTILGGLIAIIEAILSIVGYSIINWGFVAGWISWVIAIVIGIITFITGYKPGKILPLNGIVLLILGIVMIVFSSLIGGIIVVIAAVLLLV